MSRLPKEVSLIVYRYVHRWRLDDLHRDISTRIVRYSTTFGLVCGGWNICDRRYRNGRWEALSRCDNGRFIRNRKAADGSIRMTEYRLPENYWVFECPSALPTMMMLLQLPKDVSSIVYRYLYQDRLDAVHMQLLYYIQCDDDMWITWGDMFICDRVCKEGVWRTDGHRCTSANLIRHHRFYSERGHFYAEALSCRIPKDY